MKCRENRAQPTVRILLGCLLMAGLSVGLALWSGCGGSDKPDADDSTDNASDGESGGPSSTAGPDTLSNPQVPMAESGAAALGLLEQVVEAYKQAGSYSDVGMTYLQVQVGGQARQQQFPCAVAMKRPNQVVLQVDSGRLTCDGTNLWGWVTDLQDQIMRRDAPAEITLETLFPDYFLANAMMHSPTNSFSWVPLQAVLLLADDPLTTLLQGVNREELAVLPPQKIDDHVCHRVLFRGQAGMGVFWIDERSHVLRRLEYPPAYAAGTMDVSALQGLMLVTEFHEAELDALLTPDTFRMQELPESIVPTESLVMPITQVLGRPTGDLRITDLEGTPITIESLAGKVVVFAVWKTTWTDFRPAMRELADVWQANYKDGDQVAILAVNVDGPNVENQTLSQALTDWRVQLPIARCPAGRFLEDFNLSEQPMLVIVDAQGRLQLLAPGAEEGFSEQLIAGVEDLLEGGNLFQRVFDDIETSKAQFESIRAWSIENDCYASALAISQAMPRLEIAERAEPTSLAVTELWSSQAVQNPGFLLVEERPNATPRILVVDLPTAEDDASSIVELGADGQLVDVHTLDIPPAEPVHFLRTALAGDGSRWYLGYFVGARGDLSRPVHLFDENFQKTLDYPGAPTNGIGDVQLADLDGDGSLEFVAGYLDIVGAKCVSTDGTQLWAERTLVNVIRVALLEPDADGSRRVLCMNRKPDGGTLLPIDAEGIPGSELTLPGRSIDWLAAADLDGDGQSELCVLAVDLNRQSIAAVGMNLQGEELWSYPLSMGVHRRQVELAIAGQVLGDGPRQWLIATADGVIHILAADGQLIDRFAYGAELTGFRTTRLNGRPVLLVGSAASADGETPASVTAWQIDPPAAP